jgi:hypothetical protein
MVNYRVKKMSEEKVKFVKREPDPEKKRMNDEIIKILRAKVPRKKFGFPKK